MFKAVCVENVFNCFKVSKTFLKMCLKCDNGLRGLSYLCFIGKYDTCILCHGIFHIKYVSLKYVGYIRAGLIWVWCVWPVNVFFQTHWGRVTHICVGNSTIIVSDNGLSPNRHQAITWTNDGILLIAPLGTNFSEILIKIHSFSLKKMHLKTSSARRRPFCLDLNMYRYTEPQSGQPCAQMSWRLTMS